METTNKLRIIAVAIVMAGFLLIGWLGRPIPEPDVNVEFVPRPGTNETVNAPATNTGTNAPATNGAASDEGYTLAQVAEHGTKTSCWAAIDGSVYDLTKWIPMHPGGAQRILQICGKDGSPLFDKQHGMDENALKVLPQYKVGPLKK